MEETSYYVCVNNSCGRTFAKPLKTVNINASSKPYDACPFCLTEVNSKPVARTAGSKVAEKLNQSQESISPAPVADCANGFGYLGKRGAKEQIPDNCLTCSAIVQCMRKSSNEKVVET